LNDYNDGWCANDVIINCDVYFLMQKKHHVNCRSGCRNGGPLDKYIFQTYKKTYGLSKDMLDMLVNVTIREGFLAEVVMFIFTQ